MLEKLFNLIKESASETVINNPDIPNEQNNEVVAEATNTVASGFQNILAGGGLKNLLSLFGGGGNNQQKSGLLSNPIVTMMIGHFISKLTGKFNLSSNKAGAVANGLIPEILSKLINKTNDPNDNSFDMNSIIKSLSGGGSQQNGSTGGFDLQDILSKFTKGGMDTNNDGKTGLDDILGSITGGAQQEVGHNSQGGGLMNIIKGFLK